MRLSENNKSVNWKDIRKKVYKDECIAEHDGFFGQGDPDDAYAQYFIGQSCRKPLTDPKETVFIANVTFEPGCRNNWHILMLHPAADRSGSKWKVRDGTRRKERVPEGLSPAMLLPFPRR